MFAVGFILLALALLIALLGALAAFRRSAPKGPDGKRVKEPTCAACGYPARGLDTLTCPECGADFREAGILTPNMNTGPSLFVRLVMWSFALLILYPILSQVAFALGPLVVTRTQTIPSASLSTPLNQEAAFRIDASALRWGRNYQSRSLPNAPITVRLTTPPTAASVGPLELHPDGRYAFPTGNTTAGGKAPDQTAAVTRWLAAHGFDPDDPDVTLYATRTAAVADTLRAGNNLPQFLSRGVGSSSRGSSLHPATLIIPASLVGAVWITGIVIIVKRRKPSTPRRPSAPTTDHAPDPA